MPSDEMVYRLHGVMHCTAGISITISSYCYDSISPISTIVLVLGWTSNDGGWVQRSGGYVCALPYRGSGGDDEGKRDRKGNNKQQLREVRHERPAEATISNKKVTCSHESPKSVQNRNVQRRRRK